MSNLLLTSRKKWNPDGTSRIQPVEKTLDNVESLVEKIGITRIADITNMDRLKIPNFSAVLPGTEDYIWVYSGKGPTKNHAKASVIMESIERYSSLPSNYNKKIIRGSYKELSKHYNVLRYDAVIEPISFNLNDEMIMDYCIGQDILNKTDILVPASIALFRYNAEAPAVNPYSYQHTNGLASGNVLEEAICHALCELIERDAVSIAEFTASAFQYHILKIIESEFLKRNIKINSLGSSVFVDDNTIFPEIDLENVQYAPVQKLFQRFKKCHISLNVKNITSDLKIPTFIASSTEWVNHEYGYLVEGHGTHPDARIALLRAITEVSQSRAANIQGSRDDLRKMKYNLENSDESRSWQFMKSNNKIKFDDVQSTYNDDILDDIEFIIKNLKIKGLEKVIIVDLTNENTNIPVVRAIVPGLETFKIHKSVIGYRGKKSFKKCLDQ